MAFQFNSPNTMEDHGHNSDVTEAQEATATTNGNAQQASRVYRGGGDERPLRRSRPIAIPRKASKVSREDFTDDDDDDDETPQPEKRPEAMSLPATFLRAPLLGSSLPAQNRQGPPPLQLSVAAVETAVPYGSLRDHRHHQQHFFATSVPHKPRPTTGGTSISTTSTTTEGLSIADRIRQSRNAHTSSSLSSSLTQQISSLSRMMKEAAQIPSPKSPRHPVSTASLDHNNNYSDFADQLQQQEPPIVSSSMTGLQLLQGRGWPSASNHNEGSTLLATTNEPTTNDTEEGAFALDLE